MEITRFETDKPVSDTNLFTLILKYAALLMIAWIGGWMLTLLLLTQDKNDIADDWVADNGGLISLLIAIVVVLFFIFRGIRKYKFGTPYVFEFDNTDQQLRITVVNTLNDKTKTISIPYKELNISRNFTEDRLFGKQRIYRFYQNNQLATKVNIDMTAWCRLTNLDELIRLLNISMWQTIKQHKPLKSPPPPSSPAPPK